MVARSARYTHTREALVVGVAPVLAPGVVPTPNWWENVSQGNFQTRALLKWAVAGREVSMIAIPI